MNEHDANQMAAQSNLIVASTSPPPPLDEGTPCAKACTTPVVPRCSEVTKARLVSYAPPGASLGCYTGSVIDGRYRIGPILGEGGMGIVYRARHVVIDKKLAIKILRSDFARQKEITDRFLQEARAASSIGNPHIVDISDFGELPDGSTYFVMEYLEGAPLSSLLREHGPLPANRIAKIGCQIADGLSAAHDCGIVHRDLKPDNVFVVARPDEEDFIKILDFGVAKVNAVPDARMTRAGALFGTPHYMSPEQAAGTPVDSRTDVYALGIILYELASGRVPFEAEDMMGILTQHMYKKPTPLRSLVDVQDVPPALEAVILKALSKDPGHRYQTMQEVARDLSKFIDGDTPDAVTEMIARSVSAFPPSFFLPRGSPIPLPATPPQRQSLHRPPRWGVYAGVAAVLLTCAVALGVLIHGTPSRAAPQSEPPPAGRSVSLPVGSLAPPGPASGSPSAVTGPRRAPPATSPVLFAAQPLDAHVFHDDVDLGATPLTLDVPKDGSLTVEVRRKGYQSQEITLDGTDVRVTATLVPAPATNTSPTSGKATPPRRPKAWERKHNEIINPWAR